MAYEIQSGGGRNPQDGWSGKQDVLAKAWRAKNLGQRIMITHPWINKQIRDIGSIPGTLIAAILRKGDINWNVLMVNYSDTEHSFTKFQRCEKHGINPS